MDEEEWIIRKKVVRGCGGCRIYQGCARFTENLSELTKTWSSGATECGVWIGNCTPWGVLVLLKLYWAPDIVKFVLGRFSHFNIAITYSNSTFCGAWTPSFCEFTQIFSKTSTPLTGRRAGGGGCYVHRLRAQTYFFRPQTKFAKVMIPQVSVCLQGGVYGRGVCVAGGMHGGGVLVFMKFADFSSELTKSWSSGARKYWTQKLVSNLTFISFLLFVYMSVFYNTLPVLYTK